VAVRVHWVAHRGVCWIFLWLVAACLWEKNRRGTNDREVMDLMCEGATRVENGGLGCTRMIAVLSYHSGAG
jgi:hypothetical protein